MVDESGDAASSSLILSSTQFDDISSTISDNQAALSAIGIDYVYYADDSGNESLADIGLTGDYTKIII